MLFHVAGAPNDHAEDDGAMGNRDAAFACVIQAMWPELDPAGDASGVGARAWDVMKPYSTGGNYVNFQTEESPTHPPSPTKTTTSDSRRKAKYDPSNLFRANRNIPPAH